MIQTYEITETMAQDFSKINGLDSWNEYGNIVFENIKILAGTNPIKNVTVTVEYGERHKGLKMTEEQRIPGQNRLSQEVQDLLWGAAMLIHDQNGTMSGESALYWHLHSIANDHAKEIFPVVLDRE